MCVDALHMRYLLYIWKWSQIGIEQDFFLSSIESGPKVTMFLSMTNAIQVPCNTTCVTNFFGKSMAMMWDFFYGGSAFLLQIVARGAHPILGGRTSKP